MALKFSMILEAVDRATAPARRITASVRGITRGTVELARQSRRAASAADQQSRAWRAGYAVGTRLRSTLASLAGGFGIAGRAARRWAGRAGLGSWNDAVGTAGRLTGSLMRRMGGFAASAAKWTAGAAAAGGGFALFDLFNTAGRFEQYGIALETLEGSAAKGKKAMDWISKFAADTPYELDEVIQAYRNLRAVANVDPTDGSLRIVGDTAAATSKDLMQVAEAYSDALGMQFERLRDIGITASQKGDKVTFRYMRNGKAMTKSTQREATAVKAALESIWGGSFGGATEKQSKSFFGIISNLKDQWSRFLVMVANAGIFDRVKKSLEGLLKKVDEWAQNGQLETWAKQVSDALVTAWTWAENLLSDEKRWKQLVEDFKVIGRAALDIASAIFTMAAAAERFRKVADFTPLGGIKRMYDLYNWATGDQPTRSAGKGGVSANTRYWGKHAGTKTPGNPNTRYWQRPSTKLAPARPSTIAPRKLSSQNVSGKIEVGIKVDGPARATVLSSSASNRNVPIQVNLGRTMRGAA